MVDDLHNIFNLNSDVKDRVFKSIDCMFSSEDTDEVASVASVISGILAEEVLSDSNSVVCLDSLKLCDNYTFNHCVDVASIGMLIAKECNLTRSRIREVGTAGLLHDIGKQAIPLQILNKNGKLTVKEFSLIKEHPVFSYLYIRNTDLSSDIKLGVLEHHEKYCGGGYPLGLCGDNINPIARLLMIADVYSALVTKRCYKDALKVSDCISVMSKMASQFDDFYYKKFLSILIAYPDNSIVKLSDSRLATVVQQNRGSPLRPVVELNDKSVIDLSSLEYKDLSICDV